MPDFYLKSKMPFSEFTKILFMDIPPPPPPPSPLVLQLVPDEAIKIEKLFLELNENNLEIISHKVSKVLEVQPKCSLLYEFYITQCIYMSYSTQNKDASLYILFLNLLSNTKNLSFSKLLNVLTIYLYQIKTNESECLLNEMNKQKMIPSNLFYYVKRIVNKENQENQKENHILEILRNDNIEELQEMSAQNKFDFNQTIEPSPSEKSSFVNHKNVSLIDYAAFFKSIKCFKFLLINGSNVENTLKYAIAGGNLEIIHLCIQNNSTISNVLETAIQFHRNDVFYYFYDERNQRFVERKYFIIDKDLNKLGIQCLKYINYEILSFLAKEGLSKLSLSLQAAVISFNNLPFIHLFFEGKLIKNELFFDLLNNGNPIVVKWLIKQKGIKIENEDVKLYDCM